MDGRRMSSPRRATVIGAGIGGLCAAHFLRAVGFEVIVYERTPTFAPVGAGIVLGANAMRVLGEIDLAGPIAARGHRLHRLGIRTHRGRTLSVVDVDAVARRVGFHSVAIGRAALHEELIATLPSEAIVLGAECTAVQATAGQVEATFADGSTVRSDLLIGADGLHSQVRRALDLDAPLRDAQQICFRGLCNRADVEYDEDAFYESWGGGSRFGFVDVGSGRVYWFLTLNRDGSEVPDRGVWRDWLVGRFRGWWRPIPDIIAATAPEAIIRTDLYDRPPARLWHRHRAVLLGDAAHPTTPNMGQGAGMALESAAVLARCLSAEEDPARAIEAYEGLRQPRTAWITRRSWHLGRLATWSNPLAAGLRNALLRSIPRHVGQRQAEALLSYDIYQG